MLPYLDADNDQVSDAAIALCGSFPRCAERTVPLLRRLSAKRDRRGATAAVSLAVIEGPDARQLAETIATSPDPLISVLGACAAVLADADNASIEIVTILTRPLGEFSKTGSAHASTLGTLVGRCLARLGPDYKDRAATGIRDQLVHAGPKESLSLTQSLLTLIFENPPLPPASKLSETQRRALEAIRDHGGFKISGRDFGNYAMLLRYWGLPQLREGLRLGFALADAGMVVPGKVHDHFYPNPGLTRSNGCNGSKRAVPFTASARQVYLSEQTGQPTGSASVSGHLRTNVRLPWIWIGGSVQS